MSGGEVLGTALIMWLKNEEDDIAVAKRVVKAVWRRMGAKGPQAHSEWVESCDTKICLISKIECWLHTNSARCERHLIKLEYKCPGCTHGMCTVCNDTDSRTQCPWCLEPIPQTPNGHQQSEPNRSPEARCLNLYALGEQWIEEVTDADMVRATTQEYLEGKHLKFKAHIRGWEASFRERRCQSLLVKTDRNLRKALLSAPWRDILLVPHAWYPDHKPKFETPGWWYAPAEAVLGRTCKSCNAFCELADFTSTKGKRTVLEICLRCQSTNDRTSTHRGCRTTKDAPRKRTALMPDGTTLRRSARVRDQERMNYHECAESETRSDSDDDGNDSLLSYCLKLRAADPRYITHGDDRDRGDILLTIAQVRELILAKQQSEEGVATV